MKSDLSKLILGCVIGGLLAGGSCYLLRASKNEKKLFFKRIGQIVAEVGDLLKECSIEDKNGAFKEIMKQIPKKDYLANLMVLAAIGINLWERRK